MIEAPRCWERECKHYEGVFQPDGTEATEVHVCPAFPEGIPSEIAFGNELHLKPLDGQVGSLVYEHV